MDPPGCAWKIFLLGLWHQGAHPHTPTPCPSMSPNDRYYLGKQRPNFEAINPKRHFRECYHKPGLKMGSGFETVYHTIGRLFLLSHKINRLVSHFKIGYLLYRKELHWMVSNIRVILGTTWFILLNSLAILRISVLWWIFKYLKAYFERIIGKLNLMQACQNKSVNFAS